MCGGFAEVKSVKNMVTRGGALTPQQHRSISHKPQKHFLSPIMNRILAVQINKEHMTNKKATFREQIAAWKDNRKYVGELSGSYYFFDWFCREYALADRARKIMPKAIKFAKRKKVDLDKTYVMFKNNCPMTGSLYDDFRICDLTTGDVLWTVTPASGHQNIFGQAEVWGIENKFSSEIAKAPSWTELILNTTN